MADERVPLSEIDLDILATALDDHGGFGQWWFDPRTGQTNPSIDSARSGIEDDLDMDHLVLVESWSSRAAYRVMVDFAEHVADPRVRDLLLRSLEGRGAFRRFRDTIYDFEDLGRRWRDYEQLAREARAVEWLQDHHLVDDGDAGQAIGEFGRRMDEVLAEVAADVGPRFARDDLPDRWPEIVDLIDQGRTVTLTADRKPWAFIEPAAD